MLPRNEVIKLNKLVKQLRKEASEIILQLADIYEKNPNKTRKQLRKENPEYNTLERKMVEKWIEALEAEIATFGRQETKTIGGEVVVSEPLMPKIKELREQLGAKKEHLREKGELKKKEKAKLPKEISPSDYEIWKAWDTIIKEKPSFDALNVHLIDKYGFDSKLSQGVLDKITEKNGWDIFSGNEPEGLYNSIAQDIGRPLTRTQRSAV